MTPILSRVSEIEQRYGISRRPHDFGSPRRRPRGSRGPLTSLVTREPEVPTIGWPGAP
jgi:hypothetical protein